MDEMETGRWWSALTIKEKERIASKIATDREGHPVTVVYPACTEVWNALTESERQHIEQHCQERHGLVIRERPAAGTFCY